MLKGVWLSLLLVAFTKQLGLGQQANKRVEFGRLANGVSGALDRGGSGDWGKY
jgi:hypothetical protein